LNALVALLSELGVTIEDTPEDEDDEVEKITLAADAAEGVADACLFLAGKAQAGFPRAKFLGRRRRLFDMIDVLSEGAMS